MEQLARLRRRSPTPRRLLAAGLVAAAAAVALRVAAPAPPANVSVVVAARDVTAGATVRASDLRVARWPAGASAPGWVADPGQLVGRPAAGPLRSGRPVSVDDVVGPGLLARVPPGLVAMALPLGAAGQALGVRRGDRVDLLAGPAGAVATDAVVLADPGGSTAGGSAADGGAFGAPAAGDGTAAPLVLAVPERSATQVAAAAAESGLTLVAHPRAG